MKFIKTKTHLNKVMFINISHFILVRQCNLIIEPELFVYKENINGSLDLMMDLNKTIVFMIPLTSSECDNQYYSMFVCQCINNFTQVFHYLTKETFYLDYLSHLFNSLCFRHKFR